MMKRKHQTIENFTENAKLCGKVNNRFKESL